MLVASVIVPTAGRPTFLRDALQSVQHQNFANFEIIVVDNGARGNGHAVVHEVNQDTSSVCVRYVRELKPGLHHARHAGARAAQSEILVYIDDDVLTPQGWLAAMTAPFEDARVAIVAGRVLPQWEGEAPRETFPDIFLSLLDHGEEPRELFWPEGAHGCNMGVRKSAVWQAGGFHPDGVPARDLWLRGDGETGLHRKLFALGYQVIYEPRAVLRHRIPPSRYTVQALRRRAFAQGISDSYTSARESPQPWSFFQGAFVYGLRAVASRLKSALRGDKLYWGTFYWSGRARHQWRTLTRPSLRRHVLRKTYFKP